MKKVLIIDDDEGNRSNIAEIFHLAGYIPVTAENGKVGIELAAQTRPDLIISDISMPEVDGFTVLRAVQDTEDLRSTPFIFLTAKTERVDVFKGISLGASSYITKPFDGNEILQVAEQLLSRTGTG